MVLDYLSSNALNKYPFDDNAKMLADDTEYIANDCILDALIASKMIGAAKAFLDRFSFNGTSFTFTIILKNSSDTIVATRAFVIPFGSVGDKAVYSVAGPDFSLKLVFGAGMEAYKALPADERAFTTYPLEFAQSAFVQMVPIVGTLSFFNWNKTTNLAEVAALCSFTGNETADVDVTIEEGANIVFVATDAGVTASVIKGAGSGLYDVCDTDLKIKTINDIHPDNNFNFLLAADDCYVVTPGENQLTMQNICTPKCTADQLGAFAHYLNRIRDGMASMFGLASTTYNNLKDEVDRYNSEVVPSKNQPFYRVKAEQFNTVDAGRFYFSVIAGFFNPTGDPLDLDLVISEDNKIIEIKYKVGNVTTQSSSNEINVSVPCLGACLVEVVITGPDSISFAMSGSFGDLSISYDEELT